MTETEKAALERRIDELCAELGRSQLNRDMWHDRAEDMRNRLSAAQAENAELHKENKRLHADQAHWELGNCPSCPNVVSLQEALEQNAKLREQTELLVTLLRNDCDIEASWDGLRKFWYIGLTEGGCLMRDRACKAEAENAKLREYAAKAWSLFIRHGAVHACDLSEVDAVRDGLRSLGIEVEE